MNIRLLRRIQRHILKSANKGQFDMATFGFSQWADKPWCSTAHCIGGWAIALEDEAFLPVDARDWRQNYDEYGLNIPSTIPHRAMELLGLTPQQAARLFYVDKWPRQFRRSVSELEKDNSPLWSTITPYMAAKRIDHFIATRGEA